jgi:hypothetical protein
VLFGIWILWQWHRLLQQRLPERALLDHHDVLGADTNGNAKARLR